MMKHFSNHDVIDIEKQYLLICYRERKFLQSGITLIELMVVVVIVAILTAIAIPSYQYFLEKRDLALAKQEALNIAAELEKFKAKNFSYKGFDATYLLGSNYDRTKGIIEVPLNTTNNKKYVITIEDLETQTPLTISIDENGKETQNSQTVLGLNWLIKVDRVKQGAGGDALPVQPNNYDLLLTSTGLRCMSKTNNAFAAYDDKNDKKCSDIDAKSEAW